MGRLLIGLVVLGLLVAAFVVIYAIVQRIEERKKEDFEKRKY
jgi:hypothetical protein